MAKTVRMTTAQAIVKFLIISTFPWTDDGDQNL